MRQPSPTAHFTRMHEESARVVEAAFLLQPQAFTWEFHLAGWHIDEGPYTAQLFRGEKWPWAESSTVLAAFAPTRTHRWLLTSPPSPDNVMYAFLSALRFRERGIWRQGALYYDDAVDLWWLTRRFIRATERGKPLHGLTIREISP